MARTSPKSDDLVARREAVMAELAQIDEQLKAAELAARDAGRPVLLAALDRVKIPTLDKADARAIASAISQHGGKAAAAHLSTIQAS